jgi:hypothetical protein
MQDPRLARGPALRDHRDMNTTTLRLLMCRNGAVALAALAATACSGAPKPAAEASSEALRQQIVSEIGDAACDGPQQCQTLAIGHKSCGGPEAYLAWSSKRSDAATLKALAERHQAARRQEDQRQGMMSNCAVVSDPGASCQAGRCTLLKGGIGGKPQL